MAKLVIHAPLKMAQQQGKRSFVQTLITGVGDGYIISSSQLQQDNPGDGLNVLSVFVAVEKRRRYAAGESPKGRGK